MSELDDKALDCDKHGREKWQLHVCCIRCERKFKFVASSTPDHWDLATVDGLTRIENDEQCECGAVFPDALVPVCSSCAIASSIPLQ